MSHRRRSADAAARYFEAQSPQCFAHRGGAKLGPENTLEAFEIGWTHGCAFIETDVHLSADGELVVIHDARVDRTTDGHGRVDAMSLEQLRRLDAGYRFEDLQGRAPWRGKGVRIPTLEELWAFLERDPGLRVNIELKTHAAQARERLLRSVLDAGLASRVLVASAHAPTVRAFRALAKGRVATSAGRSEIALFWAAVRTRTSRLLPLTYDALQVPITYRGLRVVTRAFVQAAQARGIRVNVWTIDDPAQMQMLRELRVDGVMSDRPDLLTRHFGSASAKG